MLARLIYGMQSLSRNDVISSQFGAKFGKHSDICLRMVYLPSTLRLKGSNIFLTNSERGL